MTRSTFEPEPFSDLGLILITAVMVVGLICATIVGVKRAYTAAPPPVANTGEGTR